MLIPDYQSIMLPLLKFCGDQKEHSKREAIEAMAGEFALSAEERKQLLPSGQQFVFDNRVGWARTYMTKAGLLESTKRASFQITQRGFDVLKQNLKDIDVRFLKQYPEFVKFQTTKKEKSEHITNKPEPSEEETPQEVIENAYEKINFGLAQELLNLVKNCSPQFLERLVVEVLLKMGYGGSLKEAGAAIGQSGDGGIDGIINEDKLGLDVIYIQAKRWDAIVGRPEIQKFVGALEGRRANKGIFITTSTFSKDAKEYTSNIGKKIILIDGDDLAQLMIDYDVGVASVTSYDIKRIDSDYFEEG